MSHTRVGELDLHVVDEGEGPVVVLLHGFPDSSHLWRHQIPALVAAGYRVLAPDLRGFGASSRPVGVEHYGIPNLVNDVIGLLDALGVERAHVVGHDWGSAVAWAVAAFFPQRIASLTAISVGHPALYARPTIAQRERSWYMLFFQFEGVAETLLTRHDWALFRELMRDQGDTERAIELLSRPGALTAALSVYRANVPPAAQLVEGPLVPPVSVPTMGIWSDGDVFLLEDAVAGSGAMVQGAPFRYERVTGVGHFIPVDAPEKLNPLLLDFLKSTPAQ